MRKLGKVRGQRVSPSPLPKARSKERLPSISPDRGLDRESPTFSRNGKYRRSFDEGRIGLGKGSKPGTLKEYSIRVQCIQSWTSVFETQRERERDVSYNVIFCHYSKWKMDLSNVRISLSFSFMDLEIFFMQLPTLDLVIGVECHLWLSVRTQGPHLWLW